MADKSISNVVCPRCGRKTTRKIKWFQLPSGTECSVGRCFIHGNIMATLKVKPASDSSDSIFVVKRVSPINKTRYREVRAKRENYDRKKRERDRRYRERQHIRKGES